MQLGKSFAWGAAKESIGPGVAAWLCVLFWLLQVWAECKSAWVNAGSILLWLLLDIAGATAMLHGGRVTVGPGLLQRSNAWVIGVPRLGVVDGMRPWYWSNGRGTLLC